jgi:hypothetical protein
MRLILGLGCSRSAREPDLCGLGICAVAGMGPYRWPGIRCGLVDGVWQRSPASIAVANRNDSLLDEFKRALADFQPQDNIGSAYSVRRYDADQRLGGPKDWRSRGGSWQTAVSA